MGVLIPNYPKEMIVGGKNEPHFNSRRNEDKTGNGTMNGTSSGISYDNTGNGASSSTNNSMLNVFQILGDIWKRQNQYNSSTNPTVPEMATPFRTNTPSAPALTAQQANPVHVHALPVQNTSQSGPPAPCAHVHKLPQQALKPRELLALRKVQQPHDGRTSGNRLPLMKQDILSHNSSCFEGIGCFQGNHTSFT